MNSKKKTIILIIIFALIIAGAYFLYDILTDNQQADNIKNENQESGIQKTSAHDFAVYDEDGNKITLSSFEGKPVVLNFWASWCGPCRSEMAGFNSLYMEKGHEVQFMMINVTDGSRETVESAQNYIKEQGFEFPVYFDIDLDASAVYASYAIPATYFIDSGGNLVARSSGAIGEDSLREGIEMILD